MEHGADTSTPGVTAEAVGSPVPVKAGGRAADSEAESAPSRQSRRAGRPTVVLLAGTVVLLLAVVASSLGGAAGLPAGGTAEALLDKLPFVDLNSGLGPVQQSVLDQI